MRALLDRLGKQSILRVNSKEAGYRCRYEDGSLFVLGKYKTAVCGGLDSSFSYGGAADDLLLCIQKLAGQGHIVCEGVIAITSYGHERMTRFADKLKRRGHRMIFARIDTPAELCVERRLEERTLQKGDRVAVLGRGIAVVNQVDNKKVLAVLGRGLVLRIFRRDIVMNQQNRRWECGISS